MLIEWNKIPVAPGMRAGSERQGICADKMSAVRVVTSPDAKSLQNVIPVTLAVQPSAALAVTYANSFAKEIRLVGLPPGVAQDRSKEARTFDARRLGGRAVPEEAR